MCHQIFHESNYSFKKIKYLFEDFNHTPYIFLICSIIVFIKSKLGSIIKDEKIKAYSKIEAIKTIFAIVDKAVTDRQQQEQLTELKEQLAALEGGKIVDIN